MDPAELIGGVLVDVEDPRLASQVLVGILRSSRYSPEDAQRAGLDKELVRVLRSRLARYPERIESYCAEGAAWALGRRSVRVPDQWELVASLPSGFSLPKGLFRTTGETMVSLVNHAQKCIRLTAPFIDQGALTFLAESLISATLRRVLVEFFYPSSLDAGAFGSFLARVSLVGKPDLLRMNIYSSDAPWAHLKVITVDSSVAYIGSANITGPALTGRNLELGVLVYGPSVKTIDAVIERFRTTERPS